MILGTSFVRLAIAADGTWAVNADGAWSTTSNWSGGIVADGADFTANFTNGISTPLTVTLDTSRTIGNLKFSDNGMCCGNSFTITNTGGSVLRLDTTVGIPTIDLARDATISSPIAGDDGLIVTGFRFLTLNGANTYTGGTTVSGTAVLIVNADANLGDASSGVTLNGGYFAFNSSFSSPRSIMLASTSDINNIGASVATLSGTISGNGGLTFHSGNNGIAFTGANNYTGPTTISTNIPSPSPLRAIDGVGLPSASNLVLSQGTFQSSGTFTRGLGTGAGQVQWTGPAGFSAYGGALNVQIGGNSNTLTWGSTNFVAGNLVLNAPNADSVVKFENGIDLSNALHTIQVNDNPSTSTDFAQIDGQITNGSFRIIGPGILVLTAANTFAGGTTIQSGTLLANNVTGSATGSALVTVRNTATLGGTGTVAGSVSVLFGGTVAPGAPLGTLSITGNFTQAANSHLSIELAGSTPGSTYDQLHVTGSVSLAGILDVTLVNGFIPGTGNSFHILDWGSPTGTFSSLQLPGGGLSWDTSQLYATGTLTVGGVLGDYNHNGTVDAADYIEWRVTLGSTANLAADGNQNRIIDAGDFDVWRVHYGETAAGAGLISAASASVPEPATALVFVLGLLLMLICDVRR